MRRCGYLSVFALFSCLTETPGYSLYENESSTDAGDSGTTSTDTSSGDGAESGTAEGDTGDSGTSGTTTGSSEDTTSEDSTSEDSTSSGDGDGDGDGDGAGASGCPADDPSLRACYRFNGNLADGSMYGNDLTAISGGTLAQGVAGMALLHADGDEISAPDDPSLDFTDALTLEAWIRPFGLPGNSQRMGIVDNDGQYGLFLNDAGQLLCNLNVGAPTGGNLVLDQWAHVACVWDGDEIHLYVDGVDVSSTGASGTLNDNDLPMAVANGSPDFDEAFFGAMDELRIWSVARTAAQICAAAGC